MPGIPEAGLTQIQHAPLHTDSQMYTQTVSVYIQGQQQELTHFTFVNVQTQTQTYVAIRLCSLKQTA